MYSRQHRTSKSNSNDSEAPASNQFAPRPFVVQPQVAEPTTQQNQTADLQAEGGKTKEVSDGFPDSSVFTRHVAPPKVPRIQMKLTIGKPGDKYEQEADEMAADVVQQSGGNPSTIQFKENVQQQTEDNNQQQIEEDNQPQIVQAAPLMIQCSGANIAIKVAKMALKWLTRKGANVSAHIVKRHIAKRLGKSTFGQGGKFAKKWVTETLEKPDNLVDQGRRLVFEKQFSREVGQKGEKIVRVVVDKATGKIITAFPTETFKLITSASVGGIVTGAANEADAAIIKRRQAIQKSLEPSLPAMILDFFVDSSPVARDEDVFAEQKIIEQKIEEAINEVEKEIKRKLSSQERTEVREIILLQMETEPSAG